MARYHVNPNTGRVGQCRAKSPESCQFSVDAGTVVQHYESKEEAEKAYEKLHANETLNSGLSKGPKRITEAAKKNYKHELNKHKKTIAGLKKNSRELNNFINDHKNLPESIRTSVNIAKVKDSLKENQEKLSKAEAERLQFVKDNRKINEAILSEKKEREEKRRAEQARISAMNARDIRGSLSCGGPVLTC